jgi:hypothetical protein
MKKLKVNAHTSKKGIKINEDAKSGEISLEFERPSTFSTELIRRVQSSNPKVQKKLGNLMGEELLQTQIKKLKHDLQSERKYIFQTKRHEKWLNQRIEASRVELRHKEYERKMVHKTLKFQRRVMRNLSSDSLKKRVEDKKRSLALKMVEH